MRARMLLILCMCVSGCVPVQRRARWEVGVSFGVESHIDHQTTARWGVEMKGVFPGGALDGKNNP